MIPLDTIQYFPVTSSYYQKVVDRYKQFPDNKILRLYYDILSTSSIKTDIEYNAYYLMDPLAALIAVMDQNGDLAKYSNVKTNVLGFWVGVNNEYPICSGATIPIENTNLKLTCQISSTTEHHSSVSIYIPSQKMVTDLFDELLDRITNVTKPCQQVYQ